MCRKTFWKDALLIAVGLMALHGGSAYGQSVDYFSTPWVVGSSPTSGATASNSQLPPTAGNSGSSSLYKQSVSQSEVNAPPILVMFNLGIDDILTDNVSEAAANKQSDATALLSFGETLSADTERFTGILATTATYRANVNDKDLNQFSEYAFGQGRGIIVPGIFFINANASIDDLARLGGGVQNPIVQAPQSTHTYNMGASPILTLPAGNLGSYVLRYQIGRVWFDNNTQPISLPGLSLGQISPSTNESVRQDLRFPGSIFPRLMSDLSTSAMQDDSGNAISGVFHRANLELLNEYEITRSISIVGGGGYEKLRDQQIATVNTQGVIWDIGTRLKPNADSYFLLIYGHHDGYTDFAGELAWRLTPLTGIYAAYSDSVGTAQQSLISGNANSVLGPDGAVSGVTFDQSTVIGVLNDQILNLGPGSDASLAPLGIPLGTSDNLNPLQNGLFRTRTLSLSETSVLAGDPIALTAYDRKNTSFTPLTAPSSEIRGANLYWSRTVSEQLSGTAMIGYSRVLGVGDTDALDASVGITYSLPGSMSLALHYDYIRHWAAAGSGFTQNSISIGIHKSIN